MNIYVNGTLRCHYCGKYLTDNEAYFSHPGQECADCNYYHAIENLKMKIKKVEV